MCGLVGIAGDLSLEDEKIMDRLLILDYFRGKDSTGIARMAKYPSADTKLLKQAVNPMDLFDHKSYKDIRNCNTATVWIGHNRAATLGKVNNINAHPFTYGKITGAHNGTLDKASWERLEEAIEEETTVDSAAIFAALDKFGPTKTIEMCETGDTSVRGAWALTYFNDETRCLYMIRNKHRPLWISYSKDFKKLYWASEYPMIRAAIEMTTKKPCSEYLYQDKDGHMFFQLPEDILHRWKVEDFKEARTKWPKARVKKIEGRAPKTTAVTNYSYNQGGGYDDFFPPQSSVYNRGCTTSGPKESAANSNSSKVKPVISYTCEVGSFGPALDVDDMANIAHAGCTFCEAPITTETEGLIIYKDDGIILCPDCNYRGGTDTRIYLSISDMNYLDKQLKENANA